ERIHHENHQSGFRRRPCSGGAADRLLAVDDGFGEGGPGRCQLHRLGGPRRPAPEGRRACGRGGLGTGHGGPCRSEPLRSPLRTPPATTQRAAGLAGPGGSSGAPEVTVPNARAPLVSAPPVLLTSPARPLRRYHFHAPGLVYILVTLFIAIGAINSQNNLLFA